MKASTKITIEISMEEVRKHILTDLPAKELLEACRFELKCVIDGYANGDGHYRHNGWGGWKAAFFEGLVNNNDRIHPDPSSPYFN